jgi:hypothetical protein
MLAPWLSKLHVGARFSLSTVKSPSLGGFFIFSTPSSEVACDSSRECSFGASPVVLLTASNLMSLGSFFTLHFLKLGTNHSAMSPASSSSISQVWQSSLMATEAVFPAKGGVHIAGRACSASHCTCASGMFPAGQAMSLLQFDPQCLLPLPPL